jgi:hypothetical protein
MLAIQKDDGFPLSSLETCIDSFGLSFYLALKISIPLNAAPARGPYWDESEFTLIGGISPENDSTAWNLSRIPLV